ncbi:hypothetical protein [Frankia sp. Cj3]|uniref:hypothetical protein n=1 Tax=Frankia sp. Cj3 TaxID=2880976 RepID=UPI001EF71A44|nr:hypothetical protein [Frankia sp. Cj3]
MNVTDAQVLMEAEAAKKIAEAALAGDHASPGEYQVAVSGFGSAPAEGRSAFDRVCPFREAGHVTPTTGQATAGSPIADCVASLHKRTSSEGNDADIAGALRFFGKDLADNTAVGTRRVLVLLAGGPQFVPNVVAYDDPGRPGDRGRRTTNARDQLVNAVPGELKDKQIEVWPLGFGTADTASLDKIARSSYPGAGRCELPATPSANTSRAGEDLLTATPRTVAALTPLNQCWAKATVQVPLPATDATIFVRREARLAFHFRQPGRGDDFVAIGRPAPDGSTFERTVSPDGVWEQLHITRPMPGEWTVVATAPPGGPPITIEAHVDWDQKPRTAMLVRPAPPQPGSNGPPCVNKQHEGLQCTVNVEARLYTRADALKIPGALAGVTAQITLNYGSNDQPTVKVGPKPRFAADSGGSDIVVFATPVTLPVNANGHLDFTAVVSWPDGTELRNTSITYSTAVKQMMESREGSESVPAMPTLTIPTLNGPIPRGGEVSGFVAVTGPWGDLSNITLEPAASWKVLGVTMDPVALNSSDVQDGEPVKLTIHASKDAPLGPIGGIIQAFDAGPAHRWLGDQFVDLTIVPFPADSPTDHSTDEWMVALFVLLGVIFVAGAGAGLLEYRNRRARHTTVDGLTVWLYRDAQLLGYFEPDNPGETTMSFAIRNLGNSLPRLVTTDRAEAEAPQFDLRRHRKDFIELCRNPTEKDRKWVRFPVGDSVAHTLDDRIIFKITDIDLENRCGPSGRRMKELAH